MEWEEKGYYVTCSGLHISASYRQITNLHAQERNYHL